MPPVIDEWDGLKLVCDADEDDPDAVQGATQAARTLAGLLVRRPVRSALDLGTGCGVLALTLARHATRVVGTDVNPRAIDYARRSARLNDVVNVEWRQGDWYAPVAGERFDVIACNPPYVVSPDTRLVFRDGSQATEGVVRAAADHLEPQGLAHVLVNWPHPLDDWVGPLRTWIPRGCDALAIHHASLRPGQYAETWAEDAATAERWLRWYDEQDIEAIGAAFLLLRRRADDGPPRLQALEASRLPTPRAGIHLERILDGTDLSSRTGDAELARLPLRLAKGVRIDGATVRAVPTVGVEATLPDHAASDPLADVAVARRLLELGLAEAAAPA